MCLVIDLNYHKKTILGEPIPNVAEVDIPVIKYLIFLGTNRGYMTPYMGFQILDPLNFVFKANSPLEPTTDKSDSLENRCWRIQYGIHSSREYPLCNSSLMPFRAIIPKGTKYFRGDNGDIVSEKIQFKGKYELP